jgi:hypothetical protein
MALDVNERHLLRLGHGQEMLETDKDFSKWGRVNYILYFISIFIKGVNNLQYILHEDLEDFFELANVILGRKDRSPQ